MGRHKRPESLSLDTDESKSYSAGGERRAKTKSVFLDETHSTHSVRPCSPSRGRHSESRRTEHGINAKHSYARAVTGRDPSSPQDTKREASRHVSNEVLSSSSDCSSSDGGSSDGGSEGRVHRDRKRGRGARIKEDRKGDESRVRESERAQKESKRDRALRRAKEDGDSRADTQVRKRDCKKRDKAENQRKSRRRKRREKHSKRKGKKRRRRESMPEDTSGSDRSSKDGQTRARGRDAVPHFGNGSTRSDREDSGDEVPRKRPTKSVVAAKLATARRADGAVAGTVGAASLEGRDASDRSTRDAKARSMVPMRPEEYAAQQKIVREVFDEDTGRWRLVRGTGEIIERIVSREEQQAIQQHASRYGWDHRALSGADRSRGHR